MRRMNPRTANSKQFAISLALVLVFFFSHSPLVPGQRPSQQTGLREKRPKLVLLIAVDQFRYDYLERFGDLFAPNGFRRLMRDGASWIDTNYDHMPSYTGPGHGTMMTGAYPA